MDRDAMSRALMRFQNSLYGKFFSKPPPFDQVKLILHSKWSNIGLIHISHLPNGFLLLRCETHEAMQKLLFDGPWEVNGIILQLAPWQPFFELSFTELTTQLSGCNCIIS